MVLPEIPDFPEAQVLNIRTLPHQPSIPFAILLDDPADLPQLHPIAAQYGSSLLLPECWQNIFPEAGILISSAISGGTFIQRLQDAASAMPGRCWLLIEPICVHFALPCFTGQGICAERPVCDDPFFSDSLYCYYTHSCQPDSGTVTLFDTPKSISAKMALAQKCGFRGFVQHPSMCQIADICS